ncbi:MAG: hypothetical protein II965_10465 [Pyramidobacter sp.]|nr:hypothetical protein [Pyramidobacter sp.]
MKLGLRKKRLLRFVISLALLLCGVFALYPYLASRPQRHLRKSVASLEKTVAASVLNDIALGQDIAAKARTLAKSAQDKARLNDLAEGLEKNVKELKKELLAMPERSPQLSDAAGGLYRKLDERLARFVKAMAESEN